MANQFEEYRLRKKNEQTAQDQAEAQARQKRLSKAAKLAEDAANFAEQENKKIDIYPKEEAVTLAKGQLMLQIVVTNNDYKMKLYSDDRSALEGQPAGLITGAAGGVEDMLRIVTDFILKD